MISLFTAPTPNGRKISIALEEMQLPHTVRAVDIKGNEQKSPEFLALNPNGRIPAIIDHGNDDFAVFESGAILLYLAEKSGKFIPGDVNGRSVVTQWLMWQMSGLGPMHGQANVFVRYFPEKIPAVIARYQAETMRLFTVMNQRLETQEYLAGEYSIADMACFPWVSQHEWAELDIGKLENLTRWHAEVGARAAVQRGMAVPFAQTKPNLETGRSMVAGVTA